MNKIYRYNDLIFVEGDTKSGYLRPFEAKTLRMRGAGSAATYEKYRHSWQLIGTLGQTHRIDGDRLVDLVIKYQLHVKKVVKVSYELDDFLSSNE